MSEQLLAIINNTLDSYNILIGLILLISTVIRKNIMVKDRSWFMCTILSNIFVAISDILIRAFEGNSQEINFIVLPVFVFIYYFMSCSVVISSGYYIVNFLNKDKGRQFAKNVILISTIVYAIALITSPFAGILYSINSDNNAVDGRGAFIPVILEIFLYICFFIYLVINRKTISKDKFVTVIFFLLFPQFTQIIQVFFKGVFATNTGFTLAFLVAFIRSNQRLEQSLDFTESELDEKETELIEKVAEIEQSKLQFIKMQNHTIESLSNLVENRDEDTGEHVRRTRAYVELLAVQLMKNGHYPKTITPRYIRFLKRAAPMHDIGKIVVPDAVLKKPGRLTPEEFEKMKRHASEGGRIVHEILDGYEDPEYIQITADIAMHHHEKWDGSGYPDGLKGEEIPLCARIMAIADVFDALVSPRIYKSPMTYDEAYKIIEAGMGIHFDPVIAKEFLNIKEKTAAVNESFKIL
ncbi:MAG: HD domain-containing protein [Treponema sp.]|nr:HD domain-containing protein [Treponema sp.]